MHSLHDTDTTQGLSSYLQDPIFQGSDVQDQYAYPLIQSEISSLGDHQMKGDICERHNGQIFSLEPNGAELNSQLSFEEVSSPRFKSMEIDPPKSQKQEPFKGLRLNLNARPFETQQHSKNNNAKPSQNYIQPPSFPCQMNHSQPSPQVYKYLPMQQPSYPVYFMAVPVNPYIQNVPAYPQPMPCFYPTYAQPIPINHIPIPPGFHQQHQELNYTQHVDTRPSTNYSSMKKQYEQLNPLSPISVQTPIRTSEEFSLSFTGSNPKRRLDFSSPHSQYVTPPSAQSAKRYGKKNDDWFSSKKNWSTAGSSAHRQLSKTGPSYIRKYTEPVQNPIDEKKERLWQSATSVLSKCEIPEEQEGESMPSISKINELMNN